MKTKKNKTQQSNNEKQEGGKIMKLTKKAMIKVILQALYNLDELPNENNPVWDRRIKNLLKLKKADLETEYNRAYSILNERLEKEGR